MDSTFPATVSPAAGQKFDIQATVVKTVKNEWFQWAALAVIVYLLWRYFSPRWMAPQNKPPAVMMMAPSKTPTPATAMAGTVPSAEKFTQVASVSNMPPRKNSAGMLSGFAELDNDHLAAYKGK